ncbi:CD166 antigen-like [Lampetra fluviatilis]
MFTVSSMLKIRPQETEPTILEVSPSNFIQEGDTVTLTCVTYGLLPHIIYTFFQESTQLGDERTENVWTIPDIKRNQNGVYSCQARDTVETTVRAEHDINVHYIERLQILGIPDGEVNEGDNIMMTCSASSSGNITYHWNKDGKRKEDGHILTRLHVSSLDSGAYTCVAQLEDGSMSVAKTVTITVKGGEPSGDSPYPASDEPSGGSSCSHTSEGSGNGGTPAVGAQKGETSGASGPNNYNSFHNFGRNAIWS